ncbi:MAG: Bax inhibitor-1/YccA family protein [Actinomycetales bacterium]
MQSSNPVFRDRTPAGGRGRGPGFATPDPLELQRMYDAPSATALDTGRLTMDDVVAKTGVLFAVLLGTAALSYFAITPAIPAAPIVTMLAAFVVGMIVSFRRTISPAMILTYAALEGVFVGGISLYYNAYSAQAGGGNIVGQAILGTLAAFAAMLFLYKSGRLRATPKFVKTLMIAAGGYLLVSLGSLIAGMFGVGDGWGFRTGGLGLLLCAAGVAIASFFLVLDFDSIETWIRQGAPAKTAWLAGFGLMVTVVWIYLEILRLLAILRGND